MPDGDTVDTVVCQGCGAKYDRVIADDECPVCDRPRELPEVEWVTMPGDRISVISDDPPRLAVGEDALA